MRRGRMRAVLGAALLTLPLAGCGLNVNAAVPFSVGPGSIRPAPSLDGVEITVGSKDFTENILLGYFAELALEAAGADVIDLTNINGSNSARYALLDGQIDVQWEYTGTGWLSYLGHDSPVPGEQEQYEAVKEADAEQTGIAWLRYSPLNNTYAFGTTAAYARQHGLETTTDMTNFLKENPQEAVFCVEPEFASRPDGMPGVQATYGFPVTTSKTFGTGAIYTAIDSGICNFGEVFTTDGRISGLNLRVLEDDKRFFPQYNAAVTTRVSFLEQYPVLRDILEPIAAAIDNEQITELNKQVDVDGRDPAKVARDWMVEKGFITLPD
ncbi:glycine betaine ABC transporter substrate-binding protein [Amycolatopsis cihanbeyliensis]|nr:glycine betaine ABC transporter substrate-binding protein [Amycolatopsis cihanbeyliensis]